ncbi:hypothetical protein ACC708_37100, partial [Rhizobium ruizarguesonis]
AATASAGAVSIQVGTLVKLIRVMILGPVILVLGAVHGRQDLRDGIGCQACENDILYGAETKEQVKKRQCQHGTDAEQR